MSAASFKAAVPEPFQILGLRLKPLSLGRYRLMQRFNVGFVLESLSGFEFGDLILGVLICSMRVDEFLRWIDSPKWTKDVGRWSRKICPSPWMGRLPLIGDYHRKRHSFNFLEKIQLFSRYVAEGSACPKFWNESEGNQTCASPILLRIESTLRSEIGWTAEEVNEQPMTKAFSDWITYMEGQGHIRLMTDDETEMAEHNSKRLSAAAAEAGS